MKIIDRDDIHIISSHSNWSEKGIERALRENVYNNREAWHKFLLLFFMSLGLTFIVAGIIFFFAYNWENLQKFAKLGIMEILVIGFTALILIPKFNLFIKQLLLTASSVLIGGLFAVFGQVYQTGADAYDLFLGWTIFISLWVFVSNFPVLWLFYVIVANTTFILYAVQVLEEWNSIFVFTILFIANSIVLVLSLLISKYKKNLTIPQWFSNVIALIALPYATTACIILIFDESSPLSIVLILLIFILYPLGIKHGLTEKRLFYLSAIPFSLILIFATLFVNKGGTGAFFGTALFIIAAVTILIKSLIAYYRRWSNE